MATFREIRDEQVRKAHIKELKRTIKKAKGKPVVIKTVYGNLALQHYLSEGWHLEAAAGGQTGKAGVFTVSRRLASLTAELIRELV